MKQRFLRIAKPTAVVLAIGFSYILLHRLTGFTLHCPIRRITGLYCPGCGVGRMCFHLLRFDFAGAFRSNCVVLCLLPIGLITAAIHGYRYVRYGSGRLNRAEQIGLWVVVAILVLFGILRNIFPAVLSA
jgi:hypothetical protein